MNTATAMSAPRRSAAATPLTALHQLLLASEPARVQLRDSLLSYLRTMPAPPPNESTPAQLWATPATAAEDTLPARPEAPQLLVGDAPTLLDALRGLAVSCHALSQACHRLPIPPAQLELHDDGLNWLRALTAPASRFEPLRHDRDAQVLDLLRLRCACAPGPAAASKPGNFDALPSQVKREAAFDLARSLPFFNRDLTAYYLGIQLAEAVPEYELHVAHSLLRLASADAALTLDHFATAMHPTWRDAGLLHVLILAAVHMPSASVDWRLPAPCPTTSAVQTLLQALPAARSRADAAQAVMRFLASAPGYTGSPKDKQAIALFTHTLDRAAALVRVKSDAPAADPAEHSLDLAIARHLPRTDQWTGELAPDMLATLWASVKPALERSLPPSVLQGSAYW